MNGDHSNSEPGPSSQRNVISSDPTSAPKIDTSLPRRKLMRACDVCRRKKIRCDGRQISGSRCTHCAETKKECTYNEQAQKRPPPPGYVEDLERRYSKAQKLLSRLMSNAELKSELARMDVDSSTHTHSPERIAHRLTDSLTLPSEHSDYQSFASPVSPTFADGDSLAEEEANVLLPDRLSLLHVSNGRIYGKSSGAALVQTVLDLKAESHDQEDESDKLWGGKQGSEGSRRSPESDTQTSEKQPYVWVTHAWEQVKLPEFLHPDLKFPDDDLVDILVDLYFDHVHLITPLLHRPSVLRGVLARDYRRDNEFGAVILAVCAVSARFCKDPRVTCPPPTDGAVGSIPAGFQWFNQVQSMQRSVLSRTGVCQLQILCLSAQYFAGISAPQAAWTVLGFGLRVAQDMGAHRRKTYTGTMTPQKELLRRAWWVMMYLDRSLSSSLGRSCAVQDEDFDLGLPIDCDDEYWEHPDPLQAWKQPPGKPSRMAYFISMLKLNHILGTALRTIYSINKSKMVLGFVGEDWEKHIVAELDAALNKWIDSVPEHLRPNPDCQDVHTYRQSVTLYGNYYLNQILIHRPFISSPKRFSTLSLSSLTICTNAARSCSHILDPKDPRCPDAMINIQMPVFTAAVVLLLNIWGGKKHALTPDPMKEMIDVYRCMEMLKICEKSFVFAGRLRDIIRALAAVGNLPLLASPELSSALLEQQPSRPDPPHRKEEVEEKLPAKMLYPHGFEYERAPSCSTFPTSSYSASESQPPPDARYAYMHNQFTTLPLYTNDLARLPLFGQRGHPLPSRSIPPWTMPPPPPPANHHTPPDFHMPSSPTEYDMICKSMPPGYRCSASCNGLHCIRSGTSDGLPPPPPPPSSSFLPIDQRRLSGEQQYVRLQQSRRDSSPGTAAVLSRTASGGGMDLMPEEGEDTRMAIDQDTMHMWSNTPSSFELGDWETYLTTFKELLGSAEPGTVNGVH